MERPPSRAPTTEQLHRLQTALAERYTIEREVGHGGMATVYLAQDLKHHRAVAVKVLHPQIAGALGAERFLREIQVAARLQHPHILPLLDSGEQDGLFYYVMPFVEGESLRARLERHGELPVHDAVAILAEVVDALAYAHAHGVVHRDIKPDNILLSGRHALVMDFGVAKALSDATGGQSLTTAGVALGTPAYMAPEQAAADPHLDHRVDLYAVGIVGYELLTGRPPFAGLTPQETLAAHLTRPPDPLEAQRPGLSPALTQVLMRCLAKRPADRWQTAEELLAQLEPLVTPSGGLTPTGAQPIPGVRSAAGWRKWAVALAALAALIAAGVVALRPKAEALTLGKVTRITFEPGLQVDPAISPDGKFVAYASGPLNTARIYVRQAGGRPLALAADSGPPQRRPLWSPDGTQILFESGAGLFVMPALAGQPRLILADAGGAAWSPDGRRVAYMRSPERFAGLEHPDSIYVMTLDGGPARFVGLAPNPHSVAWSPDARWLALVSGNAVFAGGVAHFGNKGPSGIMLLPAAGGEPVPVTDKTALNTSPVWTPDSRHLLFVSDRDGPRDVYALHLDNSGRPIGQPARLTTGLNVHTISLSADGTSLAYSLYTARANVWSIAIPTDGPVSVDRATPVTTGSQIVEQESPSPDGRWLYFDSDRLGRSAIYRMPLSGGEAQQLSTDRADDFAPSVSPDGQWVAFHSLRFGTRDILVMPAGGGEAERVTDDPGEERNPAWSPDGRSLSYYLTGTGARDGVYVISKDQSGRWGPARRVGNHGNLSDWSPDGRTLVCGWIDGIWLIPAAGGAARLLSPLPEELRPREPVHARWSQDGRAIYFKATNGDGQASFWAIPATGGRPRRLVRFDNPERPSYQVFWSSNGRRFYFTIDDRQSNIYVAALEGLK